MNGKGAQTKQQSPEKVARRVPYYDKSLILIIKAPGSPGGFLIKEKSPFLIIKAPILYSNY